MKARFLGGRYDGATGMIAVAFPPLSLWVWFGRCDRPDCAGGMHGFPGPMPDTEPYVLVDVDGNRVAYEHRDHEGPLTVEAAEFLAEVGS